MKNILSMSLVLISSLTFGSDASSSIPSVYLPIISADQELSSPAVETIISPVYRDLIADMDTNSGTDSEIHYFLSTPNDNNALGSNNSPAIRRIAAPVLFSVTPR